MAAHLSVEEGKCRLKLDPRLSYAQRAVSDQYRVSRRPKALEEATPAHFIKEDQKGYE